MTNLENLKKLAEGLGADASGAETNAQAIGVVAEAIATSALAPLPFDTNEYKEMEIVVPEEPNSNPVFGFYYSLPAPFSPYSSYDVRVCKGNQEVFHGSLKGNGSAFTMTTVSGELPESIQFIENGFSTTPSHLFRSKYQMPYTVEASAPNYSTGVFAVVTVSGMLTFLDAYQHKIFYKGV